VTCLGSLDRVVSTDPGAGEEAAKEASTDAEPARPPAAVGGT